VNSTIEPSSSEQQQAPLWNGVWALCRVRAVISGNCGAMLGGITFDANSSSGVFALSGASWVLFAFIVLWKIKRISSNNLVLSPGH
jgi:hypothetical protein